MDSPKDNGHLMLKRGSSKAAQGLLNSSEDNANEDDNVGYHSICTTGTQKQALGLFPLNAGNKVQFAALLGLY